MAVSVPSPTVGRDVAAVPSGAGRVGGRGPVRLRVLVRGDADGALLRCARRAAERMGGPVELSGVAPTRDVVTDDARPAVAAPLRGPGVGPPARLPARRGDGVPVVVLDATLPGGTLVAARPGRVRLTARPRTHDGRPCPHAARRLRDAVPDADAATAGSAAADPTGAGSTPRRRVRAHGATAAPEVVAYVEARTWAGLEAAAAGVLGAWARCAEDPVAPFDLDLDRVGEARPVRHPRPLLRRLEGALAAAGLPVRMVDGEPAAEDAPCLGWRADADHAVGPDALAGVLAVLARP